ncbi:MBL fold metallo-hydrolase [Rhodobacterales bacterium 59_46_T64]|nr:MBL fold metallo-hydrolase [Rhodobacterales bacterium 59_46_T64]
MLAPDTFDPPVATVEHLEPGLRRIVAPNPSPMTYRGTNTYLLGTDEVAVIDPGPDGDVGARQLDAILNSIGAGQKITHILITHSHVDHSPLSRALSRETGAPVYALGDSSTGRSAMMEQLAAVGEIRGGEGIDAQFAPDILIAAGDVIETAEWAVRVLPTPGHFCNHISFIWGDAVFTGDHVMGWASSMVSPPDGDLTDFMASCAALAGVPARIYYPGHGAPVSDPKARLDWLVAHRLGREAEILTALEAGPATASELARAIYVDTPPALLGAAARNVLAHLIDLTGKSMAAPNGPLTAETQFRRV